MTAYQLRRHLAADHALEVRGFPYEELIALHEDDHKVAQNHDHREMR